MALGVTQDTSVLAVLKEYYGVQDVEALVFRNSPVLKMIKKVKAEALAPPPGVGLKTVTGTVPAAATSEASILAVSFVLLTKVVV